MAAISGDARRALDICRRAAELAETWGVEKVGLKEIDAAIQEMFASSKVKAISDCSVYEQLFLRAVLAELIRIGLEEAQLDKCVRQMDLMCRCEGKSRIDVRNWNVQGAPDITEPEPNPDKLQFQWS